MPSTRRPLHALLTFVLAIATGLLASVPVEAAGPAIGCVSLANLRLLLRQVKDDPVAAAAILKDDKADHMGCAVLAPDSVTTLTEQLTLNGTAYECAALKNTSLCHWTLAGSAALAPPAQATRKGAPGPEKARR